MKKTQIHQFTISPVALPKRNSTVVRFTFKPSVIELTEALCEIANDIRRLITQEEEDGDEDSQELHDTDLRNIHLALDVIKYLDSDKPILSYDGHTRRDVLAAGVTIGSVEYDGNETIFLAPK